MKQEKKVTQMHSHTWANYGSEYRRIGAKEFMSYFESKGQQFMTLDRMIESSNRPKTGVYFLLLGGRLVYVGQSKNIFRRVAQHNITHDSFAFVECPENELDELESAYIHLYRPEQNANSYREKIAPLSYKDVVDRVEEASVA